MDFILGALKIVSTGNSSISTLYSGTPMSSIPMALNIMLKNCAIRKEGARRRRGGAGLHSGRVGIVLLDWCRKIYKSNMALIFFCILDEASTDQ